MCKLATESASRQPKAYMYSILFMMSMPATIMSGFGIAFYRLSRKAARMQQEAAAAELNQIRAADAPTDPAAQRGSVVEPDSGTAGGQTAGGLVFP
jgi:hypothetical protein